MARGGKNVEPPSSLNGLRNSANHHLGPPLRIEVSGAAYLSWKKRGWFECLAAGGLFLLHPGTEFVEADAPLKTPKPTLPHAGRSRPAW